MNNIKLNIIVALIAGACGAILTSHMMLPAVHAQDQPQTTKELRAQSFILVDSSGAVMGMFTSESQSATNGKKGAALQKGDIVLRNPRGQVIWHAGSQVASFASASPSIGSK